jgi:hypothetical protein
LLLSASFGSKEIQDLHSHSKELLQFKERRTTLFIHFENNGSTFFVKVQNVEGQNVKGQNVERQNAE